MSAIDFLRSVPHGEVNRVIIKSQGRVQNIGFLPEPVAAYFLVTTDTESLDTMTRVITKLEEKEPPNSVVHYIVDRNGDKYLFDVYASHGNMVNFSTVDYETRLELARRLYPAYKTVKIDASKYYEEGIPLTGPYRVI